MTNEKINAQQYNMGPVASGITFVASTLIIAVSLVVLATRLGWPGVALAGAACLGIWGKWR